jgi:hypothetical protein
MDDDSWLDAGYLAARDLPNVYWGSIASGLAASYDFGSTPMDRRRCLPAACLKGADIVAKVVLHRWSKILRAVGAVLMLESEGPCRLTLNSWATAVARLAPYESAISSRFTFSSKIQAVATFDFCNMG